MCANITPNYLFYSLLNPAHLHFPNPDPKRNPKHTNASVYRMTFKGIVECLLDSMRPNFSSSGRLNSCHVHLPISATSSKGGRNTTNTFRQIPSLVYGIGEGQCSTLRMPWGRCCGNSAPNSSIINLRSVE
uniref:Uncharacterized protein n=1 Tax=Bactrocera dorsalis TaxID=27457 RepID=A0A034WRM1_BACDO